MANKKEKKIQSEQILIIAIIIISFMGALCLGLIRVDQESEDVKNTISMVIMLLLGIGFTVIFTSFGIIPSVVFGVKIIPSEGRPDIILVSKQGGSKILMQDKENSNETVFLLDYLDTFSDIEAERKIERIRIESLAEINGLSLYIITPL